MPELSVVIIAADSEQRAVLQVLVDGTSVARTAHAAPNYPSTATDPLIARMHGLNPDVTLVDVPVENSAAALHAIELLHTEVPEAAVFAVGSMTQPQVIVSAMRAGVREFIERPTTTTDLLEAFVRLSTTRRKVERDSPRGKVFTVVNAKGGSGATTIAVNLALALQSIHRSTALVDLAPLGHCALHLNLKRPSPCPTRFATCIAWIVPCSKASWRVTIGGLQLLAGASNSGPHRSGGLRLCPPVRH